MRQYLFHISGKGATGSKERPRGFWQPLVKYLQHARCALGTRTLVERLPGSCPPGTDKAMARSRQARITRQRKAGAVQAAGRLIGEGLKPEGPLRDRRPGSRLRSVRLQRDPRSQPRSEAGGDRLFEEGTGFFVTPKC